MCALAPQTMCRWIGRQQCLPRKNMVMLAHTSSLLTTGSRTCLRLPVYRRLWTSASEQTQGGRARELVSVRGGELLGGICVGTVGTLWARPPRPLSNPGVSVRGGEARPRELERRSARVARGAQVGPWEEGNSRHTAPQELRFAGVVGGSPYYAWSGDRGRPGGRSLPRLVVRASPAVGGLFFPSLAGCLCPIGPNAAEIVRKGGGVGPPESS